MNIDLLENELLRLEREIEGKAREVCSERNGGETWQSLNRAVGEIRSAIGSLYKMR